MGYRTVQKTNLGSVGWWIGVLLGAMAIGLSACGGGASTSLDGLTLIGDDGAVIVEPADTTYIDPSYRLGPGDEIEMNFLFDRELNARVVVRPDGGINLPILGDIAVAGQTPGHLSDQIASAYSRYYTNPQLSINLTKYAPAQCYVMGAVKYPKAVEIRPGMSLAGAIASAGGGDEGANMKSVLLIRRLSHQRALARRINLAAFVGGKGLSSDLYLNDYDIIFVPTTFLSRLTGTIKQVFDSLTPLPVFYLRGWEAFNTDLVYNRPIRPSEVTTTTESP